MKDVNQMDSKELFQHVVSGDMQGQELVSQTIGINEGLYSDDKSNALTAVLMLAGRIQMANAVTAFSTAVGLKAFKEIKESKSYKTLKGSKLPSGGISTGTWADFCILTGLSKSTVDENLQNLEAFGETALDSMQSVGMGVRDLRKLRALPEDAQKTIIESVKEKGADFDKDEFIDLMEEQAVKHRDECTELNNKIILADDKLNAVDNLLEKRNAELYKMEKELEIAKGKGSPAQIKQLEEERNKVLNTALSTAKLTIFQGLAAFEDAVTAIQESNHPCDMDDTYHTSMREIISRMMEGSASTGLDQTIFHALATYDNGVFGVEADD